MARIKDIAEKIGISSTSVSKYLRNPETKHVSAELKAKIDHAVEELQYRKHIASRNRLSEKKSIGILIPYKAPFSKSTFLNELLSGLESVFLNTDYSMTFLPTKGDDSITMIKEQIKQGQDADGFVFFVTRYCIKEEMEANVRDLVNTNLPFVVVNSPNLDFDINQVIFTTPEASSAVNFLMDQGHQRVVFVAGREGTCNSDEELHHYIVCHQKRGLEFDENLILYGDYEGPIAKGAMLQFLQKKIEFSAVYCISDSMALGVYEALKEHGLRIPEGVSVIGKHDSFFSNYLNPPLTTVRVKMFEIGVKAAEILLDTIQHGAKPKKVFLDNELILRASTQVRR